jgi:hypothetical protein
MTQLVNGEPVRYDLVPVDYMADGIERYIERHAEPGGFLIALLTNDLRRACERADDTNGRHLLEWVKWLYNYAPSGCWGSPERFEAWLKERKETTP